MCCGISQYSSQRTIVVLIDASKRCICCYALEECESVFKQKLAEVCSSFEPKTLVSTVGQVQTAAEAIPDCAKCMPGASTSIMSQMPAWRPCAVISVQPTRSVILHPNARRQICAATPCVGSWRLCKSFLGTLAGCLSDHTALTMASRLHEHTSFCISSGYPHFHDTQGARHAVHLLLTVLRWEHRC
jgi:hypothetical protein